jgi:hypothetical protein
MDATAIIGEILGPLIPISFIAAIVAVIVLPGYFRSRDRARMHETIRLAYEKGQPVPPELIEALQTSNGPPRLEAPQDRSARDLRVGVIWLAVGVGLVAIGGVFYGMLYYVGGAVETLASFAACGAIPICIGAAFLFLSYLGRKARL